MGHTFQAKGHNTCQQWKTRSNHCPQWENHHFAKPARTSRVSPTSLLKIFRWCRPVLHWRHPECKVWQAARRTAHEKSQCAHRCALGFAPCAMASPMHATYYTYIRNKLICEKANPRPLTGTSRSQLRTRKSVCTYLLWIRRPMYGALRNHVHEKMLLAPCLLHAKSHYLAICFHDEALANGGRYFVHWSAATLLPWRRKASCLAARHLRAANMQYFPLVGRKGNKFFANIFFRDLEYQYILWQLIQNKSIHKQLFIKRELFFFRTNARNVGR